MSKEPTRTDFPAGDFISENAVRAVFGRRRPTSPTTPAHTVNGVPAHSSAAWRGHLGAGRRGATPSPLVRRRADRSRRRPTPVDDIGQPGGPVMSATPETPPLATADAPRRGPDGGGCAKTCPGDVGGGRRSTGAGCRGGFSPSWCLPYA